jgi:hypothetical protein
VFQHIPMLYNRVLSRSDHDVLLAVLLWRYALASTPEIFTADIARQNDSGICE